MEFAKNREEIKKICSPRRSQFIIFAFWIFKVSRSEQKNKFFFYYSCVILLESSLFKHIWECKEINWGLVDGNYQRCFLDKFKVIDWGLWCFSSRLSLILDRFWSLFAMVGFWRLMIFLTDFLGTWGVFELPGGLTNFSWFQTIPAF